MADRPFRLSPCRPPLILQLAWTLEPELVFPFSYLHLLRYAAPPIDASNDAMSGFPCGAWPAAGVAPP